MNVCQSKHECPITKNYSCGVIYTHSNFNITPVALNSLIFIRLARHGRTNLFKYRTLGANVFNYFYTPHN